MTNVEVDNVVIEIVSVSSDSDMLQQQSEFSSTRGTGRSVSGRMMEPSSLAGAP